MFDTLLNKNTFFYSYDLPYSFYSKIYKVLTAGKINRIFLDNFYSIPIPKKLKIFVYPYKNNYTLVPLHSQIFHSTLFSTKKVTILLDSKQHKNFFTNATINCSFKLHYDELLSILFRIKIGKLSVDELTDKIIILRDNNLIKLTRNGTYLTKTGRMILKHLMSPIIYIKVREYLHERSGESNFDDLCTYILYLLGYYNSCILWQKMKKLLEYEVEFIEENYKVSAGLLFNIFKKLLNILYCLDQTKLLPPSIKCELLQIKERFKTEDIEHNVEMQAKTDGSYKEEITLDTNTYSISVNDNKISLSVGTFKLLYILVQNLGKLVPYNQLCMEIYNKEDSLFKYTLQNEKTYLCKKLKKLNVDTSIIENIAYHGYRLNPKNYIFKTI